MFPRFAVRLFVEAFRLFFPNDEPSTVSERLRSRPEDAVLDEPVETVNKLRREGNRNSLSISTHSSTYFIRLYKRYPIIKTARSRYDVSHSGL